MRQALVVIDMQACFLEQHAPLVPPLDGAVEIINHVAAALRRALPAVAATGHTRVLSAFYRLADGAVEFLEPAP